MFQYFVSEKGQLITATQSIQNARETFFSYLLIVKVLKIQYKQYQQSLLWKKHKLQIKQHLKKLCGASSIQTMSISIDQL